jgi:hypothetical protein
MKEQYDLSAEPVLEIQLTLTQLRVVVKSLSIGTDQLAKKIQRQGNNSTWHSRYRHQKMSYLSPCIPLRRDTLTQTPLQQRPCPHLDPL